MVWKWRLSNMTTQCAWCDSIIHLLDTEAQTAGLQSIFFLFLNIYHKHFYMK